MRQTDRPRTSRLWMTLAALLMFSQWLPAQIRVACIGDSVTEGFLLQDPATEAYPAQLQGILGDGYLVGNFGKSSATLLREGSLPYYKQEAFRRAMDFKADVAVIHLGLNDTDPRNFPHYRDRFVKEYVWLIDTLLTTNPRMEIYVCSMTPIFTGHLRFASSTQEWQRLLQEEILKVVEARHTHFIDLYGTFRHRPDLFPDLYTLHPDKRGAGLFAETVAGYLTGNYGGLSVKGAWGSDMVLRQQSRVTISGLADTGSEVVLKVDGKEAGRDTAGEDGKWSIAFETGAASFTPHTIALTDGKKSVSYERVRYGEVWLAIGQSNMDFRLRSATGGAAFAEAHGTNPGVSYLKLDPLEETADYVWKAENLERVNDLDFFHGSWAANDAPAKALEYSAIGYSFGIGLQEELGVPVGIMQLAVGGSPLMSWVSRESLEADPRYQNAFTHWTDKDFIMNWCRGRAKKNLQGTDFPFQRHPYDPSYNYEAGLLQFQGLPISGALWYQGESDTENSELHNLLFPLFYDDLQELFGQDLELLVVQLSSLERPSFPRFRDAQRQLADKYPALDLVISYDHGKHGDVHPTDKLPIGERLTRLALQERYGLVLPYAADAPMPASVTREGDELVISFRESRGLLSTTDGAAEVRGFAVITIEGEILPARAVISSDRRSISVTLPEGAIPDSVVYAFEMYTDANLGYEGGQPATTFVLPVR